VWALDFQFAQSADGRISKWLHVVDEFTREALVIECQRRIDADRIVATLDRRLPSAASRRRSSAATAGPELTAKRAKRLMRFSRTVSAYIEPGSPWQNPCVESFGSGFATSCSQLSCSRAWLHQLSQQGRPNGVSSGSIPQSGRRVTSASCKANASGL
jgi:hypothetical protein